MLNEAGALGSVLVPSGRPTEGRIALQNCIRLDPRNPNWAAFAEPDDKFLFVLRI